MICTNCWAREAREGSDACGACLRQLAADLADGLTALTTPELGARAIASITVEDDIEHARRLA
jgi:hypothetical protein